MRNCRQLFIVFFFFFTLVGSARFCQAIPSQFGDTGLFSQPTAETLNSGNICVGIIGNCAENDGKTATVLPVFMTLGLGSFLEAYGSYPNILFNENEEASGRGYSNIGLKIRVFGKRSSQFKLGVDGQLRRTVSGNINYDGLTDQVVRAIASYNKGTFGLHGNVGYIKPESPKYIPYENQLVYGGGLEYLPNSRLRLLTEMGIESSKSQGLSDRVEVTTGFQYFFSPHLTLNIALAKGFSDESPNWRALFGFSSCQGIGTYQTAIPRKIQPEVTPPVEEKIEAKPLKIRTLTPLTARKKVVEPVKASSKYEIPVGEQAEVVTLLPSTPASGLGAVNLVGGTAIAVVAAAPLAISSGIPLLQVAPEITGSVAATALALPVNDALTLSAPRSARSYKLNDVVKTDDNQVVGKKIVEDLRYQAKFYSISETPTTFSAVFFHKYDKALDVWIEGAGKANTKLSKSKAAPYEEITLKIDKVSGKVPYFKLHLGELSEVFEFFPLRKSVKLGNFEIKVKPVNGDQIVNVQDSVAGQSTKVVSPIAGPSVSIASSTSVTPSSNEAVTGGSGVVAPSVGVVTTTAATSAAPSIGMDTAPPATTVAASSASVIKGSKASVPATAMTSVVSGATMTAPAVGSSLTSAAAGVAPVVAGVAAGLTTAVAPDVDAVTTITRSTVTGAGAIPFSEVATSPRSGNVTTSSIAVGPTPGRLTRPVSPTNTPESGGTKSAPVIAMTPGGATVVLLNSGTAPAQGEINTIETMIVRAPVSGSVAAVPLQPVQAVAHKKFRLPSTVIFAFDDATLTEEGKAAITDVVEVITTEKRWYVLRVDGFTDNLGSDDYNIKLGLRRAISVAKYMVTNNGIDPTIVFVKSSGENDPIATNETEEGRTLNRRAEIVLFVQKEE